MSNSCQCSKVFYLGFLLRSLMQVLYTTSLLLFAGLCLANDGAPNCPALAMMGSLNKNDYDDTPGMMPAQGVLSNLSAVGTGISDACPQLSGQLQCCSADYFRNAGNHLLELTLPKWFFKQCQSRLDLFGLVTKGIVDYYLNIFSTEFLANFYLLYNINTAGFADLTDDIRGFLTLNLLPRFDRFNSSDIIARFVSKVVQEIVRAGKHVNASCIMQQVQGALNQAAIAAVGKDLALLRNSTSGLFTIDALVKNITRTLISKVPPADQCIKGLLRLTCSKCQKMIPTLCHNVCGAVVKACFAPYVAALNPQFNILWNVTTNLVQYLNATLIDLFAQQALLLNKTQLIQNVNAVCNVTTLASSFSSRQQTFKKPIGIGHLVSKVVGLLNTGLVAYELDVCDTLTISSKCWNGTSQVDFDIPEFTVISIPGQGKNPVMPFNETAMTMQAQSLGTPVTDILKSENVSMVTPAAVTVPDGQAYQPPLAPPQQNAACVGGVSSIFALLAAVLIALL